MVSGAPELAVCIRSAGGLMWTAPSNFVINARYEIDESESEVTQLCPTLWDPMDCSLPGSSLHGILQARVLEWVAISFSRGSSWPRDWIHVSHIPGRHFNLWATREAPDWWNWRTHPQIQFVKLTGYIQEKHHLVKMRNTGGTRPYGVTYNVSDRVMLPRRDTLERGKCLASILKRNVMFLG